MLSERKRLEKKIKSTQDKIREFPDGKLICTKNEDRIKWYRSDGHNSTYIPKTNKKLAEQLACKKYLTLLEADLLHEKKAIDFYLKHHDSKLKQSEQLLSDVRYEELLSPYFLPTSQELLDWMNSPYERNKKFPNQLIHKIESGKYVRSKSESMIALVLRMNRIPFRYECALHLGESTFFPDFTIRHPKTGQFFYWEHLGMMDDPNYVKNAFSKLQIFSSYGIILSDNLIVTSETKENPLNSAKVESMIECYFIKE